MTTNSQSSSFSVWRLVLTSITLWIGVIFLIVGVLLTVTGIQSASTETAFRKGGMTADAKVLDKLLERAKRGENPRTRYLISYRFRSEQGQEMDGVTEVPVEEWEALETGMTIRVTYLPDAPWTNRVEGENEWIVALVFIGGGVLFALIGGSLAFTEYTSIRQIVRVSKHGFLTQGTVIRAEPSRTTINKVPQWHLYFRYRDTLGTEHEGVSQLMSPSEGSQWNKGDIGTVRYDDQQPSISVWMGKT